MEKCKNCNGSGYIEVINEEDGETYMKICDCKKQSFTEDTLKRKLVDARIPIEYHKYTIEDYERLPFGPSIEKENEKGITIIKKIVAEPAFFEDNFKLLWIWGTDPNSCHTSLAIIIAKALMRHGHMVRFISMQNLVQMIMDFENKDALKEFHRFDTFIIDDACDTTRTFISTKSEYIKTNLIEFFSSNLTNDKKFICTSNVDVNSIDNVFKDIKFIINRYAYEIKLQGDISSYLQSKISGGIK